MKESKKAKLNEISFMCPKCSTLSLFLWDNIYIYKDTGTCNLSKNPSPYIGEFSEESISVSVCQNCNSSLIWYNDKLIYPIVSLTPLPNDDMPEHVKKIYEEARNVYPHSKKSSSALLRLALQLLCKELGKEGKNINEDIKSLVQDGLSPMIQKSLDIIRVTGNEAVHPGVIDFTDEENDIALSLFNIMNLIVEKMMVEPKEIQDIYSQLPEEKRKAIEKRDK